MTTLNSRYPPEEQELRESFGFNPLDPSLNFYGGAPGLDVGDPILPRLGLPDIPLPTQTTVRLSPTLLEARWRAVEWFGGGDLYEAEPLGEIVHNCFEESRYRAAQVKKVLKRGMRWEELTDAPPRFPNPPFFHGGIPGLEPGDRLLPPLWHGEGGECSGKSWRVFLTSSVEAAWSAALSWRGGGDVYQAHPEGGIRPDTVGIIKAEAAIMVAVVARGVGRPVPTTTHPHPPNLR